MIFNRQGAETQRKQNQKEKRMLKLGTPVKDTATGLKGMLVNMQIQLGGNRFYNFQPHGLNPTDGQPIKRIWVTEARVVGGVLIPETDLPVNVLGTHVEDEASGFNGTAVAMTLHISGCVHISVQPNGTQQENGSPIEDTDFDIRRLKGKAVPKFTEQEREADQRRRPSPLNTDKCGPRAI
jgi:hypothetical protein